MQGVKVGDVFVQDAGGGFKCYRLALGEDENGAVKGLTVLVNPEGLPYGLTIEGCLSVNEPYGWSTAKYGHPVPVEVPA